jgi:hypothetical protein
MVQYPKEGYNFFLQKKNLFSNGGGGSSGDENPR